MSSCRGGLLPSCRVSSPISRQQCALWSSGAPCGAGSQFRWTEFPGHPAEQTNIGRFDREEKPRDHTIQAWPNFADTKSQSDTVIDIEKDDTLFHAYNIYVKKFFNSGCFWSLVNKTLGRLHAGFYVWCLRLDKLVTLTTPIPLVAITVVAKSTWSGVSYELILSITQI